MMTLAVCQLSLPVTVVQKQPPTSMQKITLTRLKILTAENNAATIGSYGIYPPLNCITSTRKLSVIVQDNNITVRAE